MFYCCPFYCSPFFCYLSAANTLLQLPPLPLQFKVQTLSPGLLPAAACCASDLLHLLSFSHLPVQRARGPDPRARYVYFSPFFSLFFPPSILCLQILLFFYSSHSSLLLLSLISHSPKVWFEFFSFFSFPYTSLEEAIAHCKDNPETNFFFPSTSPLPLCF